MDGHVFAPDGGLYTHLVGHGGGHPVSAEPPDLLHVEVGQDCWHRPMLRLRPLIEP